MTSRRFVEQAKLDDVVAALEKRSRVLWLEDVRPTITSLDKARGLLDSLLARRLHARVRLRPDDPAVVLFTSGSEGAPKGVVLSSANLVGNARQIKAHAGPALTADDTFFNPLPMFHSFGLTAGLLTRPQRHEDGALPVPLHYRQVPKLVAARGPRSSSPPTPSCRATPRGRRGGSRHVRYVIAGAERVKDETRRLWDRYGTDPRGYGATECSPVIACSLPDANRPAASDRFCPDRVAARRPSKASTKADDSSSTVRTS